MAGKPIANDEAGLLTWDVWRKRHDRDPGLGDSMMTLRADSAQLGYAALASRGATSAGRSFGGSQAHRVC